MRAKATLDIGFKVLRLLGGSGVRLERMGRRLTDYILLLLTNKVIHSCHGFFAATQVYTADQLKVEERSEATCGRVDTHVTSQFTHVYWSSTRLTPR